MATQAISFPGLSSASFQHPLDLSAARTLGATPGLEILAKIVSGKFYERISHVEHTGHCIQVDSTQYPSIYRRLLALAERLDLRRLPTLFIKAGPEINAFAQGIENYSLVLYTGLMDMLSEAELDAVIAHELGHVKCDHMKYMTMVMFLREMGPASVKRQADRFDDIGADSLVEKALKVWTLLQLTHPVPVVRVRELELWASSSEYQRILGGDYRRGEGALFDGPVKLCPSCQSVQSPSSLFCGKCGNNLRGVPVIGLPPEVRRQVKQGSTSSGES